MRHPSLIAALLVSTLATPAATAPSMAAGHYHLTARWTLGGEGGWDYLTADPDARRLYVAHATAVEVVDLDRGTPIGRIEPTPGVHGVALAPALGRGFVSCGRDSSIRVFDLKTLAPVSRIALPARNPDAILFEPVRRRVFAFNGGSASVSVIDAGTLALDTTVALGGKPEFAVADGRGHVFLNLEDTSELLELDAASLAILHRWPLAPGEEPTGLAIDVAHGRLFSACSNQTLVVADAGSGKVLASLPIGRGVDGVTFDARRRVAITTNGEGTITVVREQDGRYAVVETDSTRRGARTVALDARSGRVFTVSAAFGAAPEPTAGQPHPRPPVVPGTFEVLVLQR